MASNEALQHIIDQLNETTLKEKATFGIFQYGGGPDESFVRANKEGLEIFAIELLKVVKSIEDYEDQQIHSLEFEESWIDEQSNTFIQYIELVSKREISKMATSSISNNIAPIVVILILVIIVIVFLVGLGTLISWVF